VSQSASRTKAPLFAQLTIESNTDLGLSPDVTVPVQTVEVVLILVDIDFKPCQLQELLLRAVYRVP